MTKYLVEGLINWLNYFLSVNGMSKIISPVMLFQGRHKPEFIKRKLHLVHIIWYMM